MSNSSRFARDFERQGKLAKAVMAATQYGEAAQWVDRLESLAFIVGLRLGDINWSQAPENVANDIVDVAYRQTGLEALENDPQVAAHL